MNKGLSILIKAFNAACELFIALAVCVAVFFFIMAGLIELLELTCYLIGSSEGLCLTF